MKKGSFIFYVLYLLLLIGGFAAIFSWSGEVFSLGSFINPSFIFVVVLPFIFLLFTGDFVNFFKGFKAAFVKNSSPTAPYERAWKNYFTSVLIVTCLFTSIEIAIGIWKVMMSYPEIKSGTDLQNGNALLNEIIVFLYGGACTFAYGLGLLAIFIPVKNIKAKGER